jgi:hypothetical protein
MIDDIGGGGHGASLLLGCAPGLGQAARLGWRGGSGVGVPSLGPNWPVFSADKHGPCWTCDTVYLEKK